MSQKCDYPTIVIGAGAGGLVIAIGLAKAGKRVLLIDKGTWGGDCTNFGCIPSKSLIAAANAAYTVRNCERWGLTLASRAMTTNGTLTRAREIVKSIRAHEEPQALNALGVETIQGIASFVDAHTLSISAPGETVRRITGDQIVIAAGSSPVIPKIEGLKEVPFYTNETIFNLEMVPPRLIVLGGGPIGCEMAQAFRRLGADVTIVQSPDYLLPRADPDAQSKIKDIFENEGVEILLNTRAESIRKGPKELHMTVCDKATQQKREVTGTHLLVAVGRRPNLSPLNLEPLGIKTHPKGILVDAYGRTTLYKNIWAVGDVVGRAVFTHLAENEARTVLTNLLLPWPFKKKLDLKQPIPHVTYTTPEVAGCGLKEQEAIEQFGKEKIATYRVDFKDVDRAITAGETEGFVKIVTRKWSSQILGVTIVSSRAGEMLPEVTLAMQQKIPLRKLASLIHPYPTFSLAIRKAADRWLTETVIPSLKKWIGK